MKKLLLFLLFVPLVSFGQTIKTKVYDKNGKLIGTETEYNSGLIIRNSTDGKTNTAIRQRSSGSVNTYEADGSTYSEYGTRKPNSTSVNSDGSFTQYNSQGNAKTYKDGKLISETKSTNNPYENSTTVKKNTSNSYNNNSYNNNTSNSYNKNTSNSSNYVPKVYKTSYEGSGAAAGKALGDAIYIIRIITNKSKLKKNTLKYRNKPEVETAFEIARSAKMLFKAGEYNNRFGPINEVHKSLITKYKGKYKRYIKAIKKGIETPITGNKSGNTTYIKNPYENSTTVKKNTSNSYNVEKYTPDNSKRSATEYFNRAYDKYKNKDNDGAIADYNKAIELNPEYVYTHYAKHSFKVSSAMSKVISLAVRDYSRSIELNPDNEAAYVNRGNVKYSLKDYRGAKADCTKAIELNPDNVLAYFGRGFARRKLKDYYGACADWRKAANLGYTNAAKWVREYCN